MTAPPQARRRAATPVGPAAVGCAGLVSGVLGAVAAGDEVLRPLGHLVSPWVLLSVMVSARQPPGRAAIRSALALVAAVVAFYGAGPVVRGISLRPGVLALWCVLALLGGTVLGLLLHRIGRRGTLAVVGTAAALGLLIGDVHHEMRHFGAAPVLLGFALAAACAILVLARPTWIELVGIAVLTWPATVIAITVVAAPDTLEKLLVFG